LLINVFFKGKQINLKFKFKLHAGYNISIVEIFVSKMVDCRQIKVRYHVE